MKEVFKLHPVEIRAIYHSSSRLFLMEITMHDIYVLDEEKNRIAFKNFASLCGGKTK